MRIMISRSVGARYLSSQTRGQGLTRSQLHRQPNHQISPIISTPKMDISQVCISAHIVPYGSNTPQVPHQLAMHPILRRQTSRPFQESRTSLTPLW